MKRETEGVWSTHRRKRPTNVAKQQLSWLASWFGFASSNPKGSGIDVYDPRLEQTRAIQQAIYESALKSKLGVPAKMDFRAHGRLDAYAAEQGHRQLVRDMIREQMFQVATGHLRNQGWLRAAARGESGLQPTKKTVEASRDRYVGEREGGVDALIQNRQSYEESLALARKDDAWFRVVQEVGPGGKSIFCVWPLRQGERVPVCFSTARQAEQEREKRQRFDDPTLTLKWWAPGRRVAARELAHWLPLEDAFRV